MSFDIPVFFMHNFIFIFLEERDRKIINETV